MKKTEPIIPALSDEEVKEMMMDEYEMKLDMEEEQIESFPTTEEIKEVFTGDWDRKFNLPELTEGEPTTAEAVPVIESPKNTVRYIDSGFTF